MDPQELPPRLRIASPWHTALVVLAIGINAWVGQIHAAAFRHSSSINRPAIYLRTLAMEWFLLAVVLAGVRLHKSPLQAVLGPRWRSSGEFFRDFGLGLAFLLASITVSSLLRPHALHGATDPAIRFLIPVTASEKWLWVLLAATAGICEEAVFRGYLQHQFTAFTRNAAVGIAVSAALFGAAHAYQGWRSSLTIAAIGAIAGILAWWRKSVRPGMLGHAVQDLLAIFIPH